MQYFSNVQRHLVVAIGPLRSNLHTLPCHFSTQQLIYRMEVMEPQ